MADDEAPAEDGFGPVRSYALAGGRVTPSRELDRTFLVKARPLQPSEPLQSHYEQAFELCRAGAISVAEIAARLGRPLQIVKIWLADLLDDGYLTNAMPASTNGAARDPQILGEILAGLRRL
ncbi:DUF742 domain-containing protein [Streptomyces antibioticus]|uniref:DUF742 domain-containing protein n=1 Tax=Streptomyces antibioticus TaxID=1890 RepID=UPI0033A53FD2